MASDLEPRRKRNRWVWVLAAMAASCFLCMGAGAALALLGVISAEEPVAGAAGSPAPTAEGAAGGYALAPPPSFKPNGQGRWLHEQPDGTSRLTVELIRLPSVPGLEEPEAKLAELWRARIGADWTGASATPFLLRRYVSNGAVAHFTGAELRTKAGQLSFVSLYLVEAGDRLEPLVFIQQWSDPTGSLAGADMMAGFSWKASHAAVEAALAGVQGSPVRSQLIEDEAVLGRWVYGNTSTAQWLNTITGSSSMTAVAYSVNLAFEEDSRFTYSFNGASGQVGQLRFATNGDQGRWRVEHDLLVLEGDSGRARRYLVVGASRAPDGKRTLLLMSEGSYTTAPFAVPSGELFVEEP